MTDTATIAETRPLVERMFHPDVLAAHAQFGGDLRAMQALYDRPDHLARIAALEAKLAEVTRERDEAKLNLLKETAEALCFIAQRDRARKAVRTLATQKRDLRKRAAALEAEIARLKQAVADERLPKPDTVSMDSGQR